MRVATILLVAFISACSTFEPFQGSDTAAANGIVGDWSWPYKGKHWKFIVDGTCTYIEYADSGHFFFEEECIWKVRDGILYVQMNTAMFPNQSLQIGAVSSNQLVVKSVGSGKLMKLVPTKLLTSQSSKGPAGRDALSRAPV